MEKSHVGFHCACLKCNMVMLSHQQTISLQNGHVVTSAHNQLTKGKVQGNARMTVEMGTTKDLRSI